MKIAIVILNYNGRKLLEQFLPSVIQHSEAHKIYVADNASTDDSITFLRNNYPEVTIICNRVNLGYAGGYNEALASINEDIICLLNSDVEVTKNWLPPIISLFEADLSIAAIQPKILDYNRKDYFEYAGAAGGYLDKYGYPFCRGRIFNSIEKDEGQYNDETQIFWATGACLFLKNDVFKLLGGFDASFFAHMEEIDLCWRINNLHKKVYYTYKSEVYHVGGGTLNKVNAQKTFLNFRNSLYMLHKNLPEDCIKKTIGKRKLLDILAFLMFMVKLQFTHAFAIVKAQKYYNKQKDNLLNSSLKNVKTNTYYKTTSIVYNYYLKGIKTYRNLI